MAKTFEFEKKDDAYAMLSVATKLSPNGIVQTTFGRMYNAMQNDGESYDTITTAICGALYDGLKNGNWPDVKAYR